MTVPSPGLPPYIDRIAADLRSFGHAEASATALAVNAVRSWRGKVRPATRRKLDEALRLFESSRGELPAGLDRLDGVRPSSEELGKLVDAAQHRRTLAESAIRMLRGKDETAAGRARAVAESLLGELGKDDADTRARLDALVERDRVIVEGVYTKRKPRHRARRLAEATPPVAAEQPAKKPPPSKGRTGKAVRDPEFEKLHPRTPKGRTGGGTFALKKGQGMEGEPDPMVQQLQQRVNGLGIGVKLAPDGRFGTVTEEGIKAVQKALGLPETGEVDERTTQTLRTPPMNADGSIRTVAQVEAEEKAEKEGKGKGGSKSKSSKATGSGDEDDGDAADLDPADAASIRAFQEKHGLKVDGVIGAETQKALLDARERNEKATRDSGKGKAKKSEGDAEREQVEAMLTDLGWDVEGDLEAVIRRVQEMYGMRVDGKVSPMLLDMIERLHRRRAKEPDPALGKPGRTQETLMADLVSGLQEAVAEMHSASSGREFTRARARAQVRASKVIAHGADGDALALAEAVAVRGRGGAGVGSFEKLHPRDRLGRWREKIDTLSASGTVKIGDVTVTRERGTYHVHGHGGPAHHVSSAGEAAKIAASEEQRIKAGPKRKSGKEIMAALGAEMIEVDGVRASRLAHAARLRQEGADAATIDRVAFGTRAASEVAPHDMVVIDHYQRARAEGKTHQKALEYVSRVYGGGSPAEINATLDRNGWTPESEGTGKPTLTSGTRMFRDSGKPGFESQGRETPKGRPTLELRTLPTEWLVANGYAVVTNHPERTQRYGNAGSGLGQVSPAWDSVDFKVGLDVERVFMHYLTGKKPKNAPQGSRKAEQFNFTGKGAGRTAADRQKVIAKLTAALDARAAGREDDFAALLIEAVEVATGKRALTEVKSSALPSLDKSPKENWVDKAGGLPKYIDRIAKHLHYEKGMKMGHAIASAINAAKKMCASGDLNFPGKQNVNAGSKAQACKAVAEWTKMKARTRMKEGAAALVEAAEREFTASDLSMSLTEIDALLGEIEASERRAVQEAGGDFTERLHPRNRLGQFREKIGLLKIGQKVRVGNMTIERRRDGYHGKSGYVIRGRGRHVQAQNVDAAARIAADADDWTNDPEVKRAAARDEKRDALWREHNGKSATIDGKPAKVVGQNDGFMLVDAGGGYGAVYAPETVDRVMREQGGVFTGGEPWRGVKSEGVSGGARPRKFGDSFDDETMEQRDARRASQVARDGVESGGALVDSIRVGDRVTIRTPQGQERSGRAVMRGPAGWVLNMGGAHGTPGIASERNIVKVKSAGGTSLGLRSEGVSRGGAPAGDFPSYLLGLGKGKHEIMVNGVPFTLYYDEQGAVGDSGSAVKGDKTGDWEVFRGHGKTLGPAVARVHVSPHGSSGYGNDAAPRYAAEQVARAIMAERGTGPIRSEGVERDDALGQMRYRVTAKFKDSGGMYDDSKTGSLRTALSAARALVDEGDGDVTVYDNGTPMKAEDFIAKHSERVMGSDAARAVGRFKKDGPDGFRAATWPGAKLRKSRATAVDDERKYLENRHRDLSAGDLPDRHDFKYLSDEQIQQLVDRVMGDESAGELKRYVAGEANRRATRRRGADGMNTDSWGRPIPPESPLYQQRTEGVSRERARDDEAQQRVERRMLDAETALRAAQREGERVGAAFTEKYPGGKGVTEQDQMALNRVNDRLVAAMTAYDAARREHERVLGLHRERYMRESSEVGSTATFRG